MSTLFFELRGDAIVLFVIEILVCVLLILLVRQLFGKTLGPVTCRLLWGVLILRCLIPVSAPILNSPFDSSFNRLSEISGTINPESDGNKAVETATNTPLLKAVTQNVDAAVADSTVADSTVLDPSVDNPVAVEIAPNFSAHEERPTTVVLNTEPAVPITETKAVAHVAEPVADGTASVALSAKSIAESPVSQSGSTAEAGSITPSQPLPVSRSLSSSPSAIRLFYLFVLPIWLTGCILFLAIAVWRNRRTVCRASRSPEPVPDWVQTMFLECRDQLKLKTWPVLIITPYVDSPCLAGAIRPRILLPKKLFAHKDDTLFESMRHVLLHEMTHLKQGDIWFSWCWTLTLALHWYNPILWWVGRFVSFDCEAACDQRVLERLAPERRREYGYSLLEILKKLNPPAVYSPGFNAVVENTTNFERRLVMITKFRKRTTSQAITGLLLIPLLLAVSLTTFAEQKPTPLTADKAKMIGYVEDFFMHNYRDVTMRKSLEWGDVTVEENGNSTIRYKYECLIWDKDRMVIAEDFTFDKDGNYVSTKKIERVAKTEKADTSTKEGMQKLVEKFFSQNWRDITDRKTLEWGEPTENLLGIRSIRYKCEATFREKEKITYNRIFSFTRDGYFVSVDEAEKGIPKLEGPAELEGNLNVSLEKFDPMKKMDEIQKMSEQLIDIQEEIRKTQLDEDAFGIELDVLESEIDKQKSGSEKDALIQKRDELHSRNSALTKKFEELDFKAETLASKIDMRRELLEQVLGFYRKQPQSQKSGSVGLPVSPQVTKPPQTQKDNTDFKKLMMLKQQIYQLKQRSIELNQRQKAIEIEITQAGSEPQPKDLTIEENKKRAEVFLEKMARKRQNITDLDAMILQTESEKNRLEAEVEYIQDTLALKQQFPYDAAAQPVVEKPSP